MSTQLSPGDVPESFSLPDAHGVPVDLDEYRGRSVVVYFYPKAETPGCTTEACDFRDNLASLQGAGYSVLGISPDDPDSLESFSSNHGLAFPLLSDEDFAVSKAWGAYGDKEFNGQTFTGTIRSTVVLNSDGKVEFAQYNVNAEGHVAELKSALGVK
ncbi:peroxiredoxin [Arthrobacter castelli]|uniref:peroxiredoxin n=1 Tax=Arthrobacter castelli TaxID=271431 RepID=UPI00041298B8|nr:peroxiredoxin [Arthrobacter castelli]